MRNKKLLKFVGVIISLVLIISCSTTSVYAQSSNTTNLELELPINVVEELEDGYKIITEYQVIDNTRSTIQTKAIKRYLTDDKNVELCAFYLYGDFNIDTQQCVNSYVTTTTSGGQWRVENATQTHDYYTAYGSCNFVRRILGIKVDNRPVNVTLSYN